MSGDNQSLRTGKTSMFGKASRLGSPPARGEARRADYGEFGSSVVEADRAPSPEPLGNSPHGDAGSQNNKPAARSQPRTSAVSFKTTPSKTLPKLLDFGPTPAAAAASIRGNSKSDQVTGVVHCSTRDLAAQAHCWGPIGRHQDKFCTLLKKDCSTASHEDASFHKVKPDRFYIMTTGTGSDRAYCLPALKASHPQMEEEPMALMDWQMHEE